MTNDLADVTAFPDTMTTSWDPSKLASLTFEALALPVVVVEGDGTVLSANPYFARFARLQRVPPGTSLRETLPVLASHPEFQAAFMALQSEAVQSMDVDVEVTDDVETARLRVQMRRLEERGPILVTLRDKTEERRYEERQRSERQLETVSRLAGGVAHDFNNILTVIQSFATFLIQPSMRDEGEVAEIGNIILESAERAARLTKQLLAFSRQQIFELTTFDLNDAARGIEDDLVSDLSPGVTLSFELSEQPLMVHADRQQIEQVIRNLVCNADDAASNEGWVQLTTRAATSSELPDPRGQEHWIKLTIRDNGVGMTEQTRGRMFEPFFTTKPFGQGTGLGLSAVHGTVEQLGGFIDVRSREDKGTTFTVWLPAAASVTQDRRILERSSDDPFVVLLVEDDPLVREATRRILSRADFVVIEAKDGQDALSVIGELPDVVIDVLVTDVVMPHMSGPELASFMLADPRHREMRVIFTSGYPRDLVFDSGQGDGRVEFLQKPYLPRHLVSMLRRSGK